MIDFIAEIIFGIICNYPGAFIRWVIFRKKKFKEYLDANWYVNMFPVLILISIILMFIKLYEKFIL